MADRVAAMISIQGASLIATLYPIALLVIGVESRGLPNLVPPYRWAIYASRVAAVLVLIAVWVSIASIVVCVVAVASGKPISGATATFVAVSGYLLASAAAGIMLVLVEDRLGILDWGSDRQGQEDLDRGDE
jgi:hypothetical protein